MSNPADDMQASILAVKAVDLAQEKARALKVPLYYVENGFLVEEHKGKKKKISSMKRNQLYGGR